MEELRHQVGKLYSFQCGYCEVREIDVGAPLTVDHFQPRSKGGSDSIDNLVYCCHACNTFKGNYWQPHAESRILHPKQDTIEEHLAKPENGIILALTRTGAFHLTRLRLNRDALVAHRREQNLLLQERTHQKDLLERIVQLDQRIETLQMLVAALVPKPMDNDPS